MILITLVCILIFNSIMSFFLPFMFGRYIGPRTLIFFICFNSFINIYLSILIFIHILLLGNSVTFIFLNWLTIDLITINFGVLFDSLSASMLIVITTISFCAQLYSVDYLSLDSNINRYFSYLSLFTFFMIFLVLSENVIQLFIGWEGVGICSYLLINFWFSRYQANKASILAILANKIGDITLLISCLMLQYLFKTVSFDVLNTILYSISDLFEQHFLLYELNNMDLLEYINDDEFNNFVDANAELSEKDPEIFFDGDELYNRFVLEIYNVDTNSILELISILLVLACVGKSAQFGFHIWLPEAMEGPTPVSSLIHAATMVTAGIFLVLRFSEFFSYTININVLMIFIGSLTVFFAASIGIAQTDLKKIVAFSTCSQLGYMFLSCGFNNYIYSMYHLFIHAFFKALLFLAAGYILHLLSNEQDIRQMGGLLKLMPLSYMLLFIGSYSLIGFPYLAGYYSKEPLLEQLINTIFVNSLFNVSSLVSIALFFACITILFTLVYSLKSILDIFFYSFKGSYLYIKNLHYSNIYVQIPLALLSIFSIYTGYIFHDIMIGINSNFLSNILYTNVSNSLFSVDLYELQSGIANPIYKHSAMPFIEDQDESFLNLNTDISLDDQNLDDLNLGECEGGCNIEEDDINFIIESEDINIFYISEYFTYYRSFFFFLLCYVALVYIVTKYLYRDFLLHLIVTLKSFSYLNVFFSKKYISFNKLVVIRTMYSWLTDSNINVYRLFDKGLLEFIGPYGIVTEIQFYMKKVPFLQTGYLYHYIGYIFIVLILMCLGFYCY